MVGRRAMALALTVTALSGCAATVDGTATWPGAVLGQALLTESDFPAGVQYGRIPDQPGQPDGADGPGSMLSRPQGCANALTTVIKQSAEQSGMLGPGSAAKYAVSYDGARIVMTLLSWNLDLDALNAAADRCAQFEAFFDPASEGIPMTTTALPGLAEDALAYQQTMTLGNSSSSVYMAFQNVDRHAVFGVAFPAVNPEIDAKAALPQTFLDVFSNQVNKLQAS
jgi:hypothetical protein